MCSVVLATFLSTMETSMRCVITCLLATTLLSIEGLQPHVDGQRSSEDTAKSISKLLRYRGKELRKLDKDGIKELLESISKIMPKRTYRDLVDFRPWHVWEFHNKNE